MAVKRSPMDGGEAAFVALYGLGLAAGLIKQKSQDSKVAHGGSSCDRSSSCKVSGNWVRSEAVDQRLHNFDVTLSRSPLQHLGAFGVQVLHHVWAPREQLLDDRKVAAESREEEGGVTFSIPSIWWSTGFQQQEECAFVTVKSRPVKGGLSIAPSLFQKQCLQCSGRLSLVDQFLQIRLVTTIRCSYKGWPSTGVALGSHCEVEIFKTAR
mmetsp:Transcript_30014/g.45219  ORF Transcript_30014/g.45219 Transcript_30014/m.45219 type:complete len:210 (-) Transcript_30014:261-890(-)